MQRALDEARRGVAAGQSPFGCAIAAGNRLLAAAHNTVWADTDITAHAEINALRQACQATGSVLLDGALVASTCEPCPMCMAALHWARVWRVLYGATIDDAKAAGFNELALPAAEIVSRGDGKIKLTAGLLAGDCLALLEAWRGDAARRSY